MNAVYARDLDLNLLRVFVVVAESGSVTAAAQRLYLTQPAVSSALKRLATSLGSPLFTRVGRGLSLTARGDRLLASARPHLDALVEAALSPAAFDPKSSDRTIRLGLSDTSESWLMPALLAKLDTRAPHMRVIVLPVQFRNVAQALTSASVDLALSVADELPAGIDREPLFSGGFSCVFDPRKLSLRGPLTVRKYLEQEHVIVSYNGDLRGVVEDALGLARRVRVSVPSFQAVGALIEGSRLVATVPELVAREIRRTRPHLALLPPPFTVGRHPIELLSRAATRDDPAISFMRDNLREVVRQTSPSRPSRKRRS